MRKITLYRIKYHFSGLHNEDKTNKEFVWNEMHNILFMVQAAFRVPNPKQNISRDN